jgi:eukaryotic-like serine/threonine-protein kinase
VSAPTGPSPPRVGRLLSSDPKAFGGHAPGTVLAGRFRIIGLLGIGGMGEVYRADDLKLGQPVALKFLPQSLVGNDERRERFYSEVRLARQVSHPNVCRVYDVDEVDGQHFLSMEYIDGEDLASLLKRIGHLPATKVLEIAHQLCAGLGAAHHKGVLHRDLKPANIMIDGRGYVRITDFGLAIEANQHEEHRQLLGTPVYMAPEQLAGQSGSVRTDIYALGLVLYELCTGRTPFNAKTFDELQMEKASWHPTAPSEFVRDLDPAVERVILRCIEKDPRSRPTSVLQIAAALPGGDPLAAAIAAGETPSPEMVAASTTDEGLTPGAATALAVALVVCTGLTIWLGGRTVMTRRIPLQRPPEAFVERARQIADKAGYGDAPRDSAFGVKYNDAYLRHLEQRDQSTGRWAALSANASSFWYRQSAHPLRRLAFSIGLSPSVTPDDPPLTASRDLLIVLNSEGRLLQLTAVPGPSAVNATVPAPDVNWAEMFRDAGLNMAQFAAAGPEWIPPFAADRLLAWARTENGDPAGPLRVEGASFQGKPIEFHVVYSWSQPARTLEPPKGPGTRASNLLGITFTGIALFGGLFLARRNLRLGRGDRRGAFRLVGFVTTLLGISWILDEHHLADVHEWYLIVSFAGRALVIGGLFWGTYVAFEPYVRRHWPRTIVSWTRLLSGAIRDPLIGRDVIVGCVVGALITCLLLLDHVLPSWLGWAPERFATPTWRAWLGPRAAISLGVQLVCNALLESFTALFLLVLIRIFVRREIATAIVSAALLATPDVLLSEIPLISGVFYFLIYFLAVLLLMRVGLVAVIALRFCVDLLQAYPIVSDLSAWYASLGLGALAVLGLIAAFSIRSSLHQTPAVVFQRGVTPGV